MICHGQKNIISETSIASRIPANPNANPPSQEVTKKKKKKQLEHISNKQS